LFLSSEDISKRIVNSSAPILFIDTCIFLDILRSTFRDNIHVDAIISALSLITEQEYNHCAMGMQRSIKCLAPAKKGKSEPKDCVIFEAFLDISRRVRKLGYSKEIYFVTSNSNDYGKANNLFVIDELNRIKATLIDNLPWALAVVEGRG